MATAHHDELWRLVKKHVDDYQPYGTYDRTGHGDCSCGCKFYHPLEGKRGQDWGVCFNMYSHRRGLLTFEHQGCKEFTEEEKDG